MNARILRQLHFKELIFFMVSALCMVLFLNFLYEGAMNIYESKILKAVDYIEYFDDKVEQKGISPNRDYLVFYSKSQYKKPALVFWSDTLICKRPKLKIWVKVQGNLWQEYIQPTAKNTSMWIFQLDKPLPKEIKECRLCTNITIKTPRGYVKYQSFCTKPFTLKQLD